MAREGFRSIFSQPKLRAEQTMRAGLARLKGGLATQPGKFDEKPGGDPFDEQYGGRWTGLPGFEEPNVFGGLDYGSALGQAISQSPLGQAIAGALRRKEFSDLVHLLNEWGAGDVGTPKGSFDPAHGGFADQGLPSQWIQDDPGGGGTSGNDAGPVGGTGTGNRGGGPAGGPRADRSGDKWVIYGVLLAIGIIDGVLAGAGAFAGIASEAGPKGTAPKGQLPHEGAVHYNDIHEFYGGGPKGGGSEDDWNEWVKADPVGGDPGSDFPRVDPPGDLSKNIDILLLLYVLLTQGGGWRGEWVHGGGPEGSRGAVSSGRLAKNFEVGPLGRHAGSARVGLRAGLISNYRNYVETSSLTSRRMS